MVRRLSLQKIMRNQTEKIVVKAKGINMYKANGNNIEFHHRDGEFHLVATCDAYYNADAAVKLLNKAISHNVKRQYTKAATFIAMAAAIDSFKWVLDFLDEPKQEELKL